jgi:hypothetical protein
MGTLAKILRTIGRSLTWPDYAAPRYFAPWYYFGPWPHYYRHPSRSEERRSYVQSAS